jgi:hypothetical protein
MYWDYGMKCLHLLASHRGGQGSIPRQIFLKLFISNHNYIRFYKFICCDSMWHEEAYPKISPH